MQVQQVVRDFSVPPSWPASLPCWSASPVRWSSSSPRRRRLAPRRRRPRHGSGRWAWAWASPRSALSWWYREPVLTAWSTPGAALIAGTSGVAMGEAVGRLHRLRRADRAGGRDAAVRARDGPHPASDRRGAAGRRAGALRPRCRARGDDRAAAGHRDGARLPGRPPLRGHATPCLACCARGWQWPQPKGACNGRVSSGMRRWPVWTTPAFILGRLRRHCAAAVRRHDGFAKPARRGCTARRRLPHAGVGAGRGHGCGHRAAGAFRRLRLQPCGHHRGHLHGPRGARRPGSPLHRVYCGGRVLHRRSAWLAAR